MQCQRMHRPFHLGGERRIHLLVPGNPGAAVKSHADQNYPKMGFRVRRHTVLVAFIGNVKEYRGKPALQLLFYVLLHCH
jgi:hypothetical protein